MNRNCRRPPVREHIGHDIHWDKASVTPGILSGVVGLAGRFAPRALSTGYRVQCDCPGSP